MTGWGILATGKIAHSFARDLREVPGARLAAVGSRHAERALVFADEFGAGECTAHGSYEALVEDPSVDVVYVASPHALHLDHARLAFEAGKHVLCEKPLTLNLAEAREMVRLSVEHGRFLMEAMWTLCHPLVRELSRRIVAGDFGVPRQVHADLGWVVDRPPTDRMLDPALGGGALLDMGVYPLTFAQLVLGRAELLTAVADLSPAGVDLDVAIAARHIGGGTSALSASMTSRPSRAATIATTTGLVEVAADFHHPPGATWRPHDGRPEAIVAPEPVMGQGYGNEAAEVMRCIDAGLTESPLVPHAFTLDVIGQMDELRRQIGVVYPGER
ncbi:Gfo/Idh/MocA family protein [Nocardioides jensenii]|uniref:Gfo/Idh/MocA family protein n=1 Tax=Nocardioides jensenii TaxID=1843 RepID=UPI000831897E|nr:Gfo/Idh/MocA family oxidoreductase [Nocardioides jensenii]